MSLKVLYQKKLVGKLFSNDNSQITFEYSSAWKESSDSFPVSFSMPLSGEYKRGREDHRFFANLLPESKAREGICRGLGISIDNDYQLLKAIGGECAGALQIVAEDYTEDEIYDYQLIPLEEIARAVKSSLPYTRLNRGGKLRLSLAGAQDKWPVYIDKNKLYWPGGGAPSSHILKLSNRDFKGLHINEAYSTFLASQLLLPTIKVDVGDGYSLTPRYDREQDSEGDIIRIHQEDFCQALGFSSHMKYESEGGPHLSDCVNLIRRASISPAEDVLNIIRWQVINLLIGNSDGHVKNLSILYTSDGPRLAPFYDIVSTRIYKGISRNMALYVGSENDPGQIRYSNWLILADELEIKPALLERTISSLIKLLEENLPLWHKQFIKLQCDNPVLERINQLITKQIRRSKKLLEED
ncbi:MAG: type II toxin-antitoxin system HipA family toxin [Spirochaetia bacterium]|jgi:serine/threonine-protein kinase HipA|nr:type II toxin-antitoxin system HipA family toxin [Spirochaetia bacterium]